MSLSGALSNAMSGLRAASRGAEVVSSNISNALTPGYGRKVLELSTSSIGAYGGVTIAGTIRMSDDGLAGEKRMAEAEKGHAVAVAEILGKYEELVGTPDNPMSISAKLTSFENSLTLAASRPDAPDRLLAAATEANSLARSFNRASEDVQLSRIRADEAIAGNVSILNDALKQVQKLNVQITAAQSQGAEIGALQDQRQQVLDKIGVLVPVRVMQRDHGQIAVYTHQGTALVDGKPAKIEFGRTNTITPGMSLADGTLSGLSVNGRQVRTGSTDGALSGGQIGAQFAIRDELAPDLQGQLDSMARDLILRFQTPAADPSLNIGDAGLFTDAGIAFNASNSTGLAGRVSLNAAVDADAGGQAWRMRDGVNAAAPGNVGNATLLKSLSAALVAPTTTSGRFGGAAFTASGLVTAYSSEISLARGQAEQSLSYASARLTELTERQLSQGVDSDDEIQRLMVIEQVYAANARMIQAVDEMMQTMLRI